AWRRVEGDGGRSVLPRYRELCLTLGRDVRVSVNDGASVEGRAVDIAADGSLVVETSGGRRSVHAGDVVHVR
ncbi:MAG TPA: biotin--[acetyl-CoA-carboxylase] ligase, partial [Acidothermaceae bacterium]|nr:biotin--[acetyl-CoA-carboxylase] ligase [Acidothermaceae bacterium]